MNSMVGRVSEKQIEQMIKTNKNFKYKFFQIQYNLDIGSKFMYYKNYSQMSQRSGSPSSDRNFPHKRKKIAKSRFEDSERISESGQSKITHFFKNAEKKQKPKLNPIQKLQRQLQQELEQLKEQQQQLMSEKQFMLEQQTIRKDSFENWIKKSKDVIQDCLTQIGANNRFRKAQVDSEKGYYDQNCRYFIQGIFGQQCQEKRNNLLTLLNAGQYENESQKQMITQMFHAEDTKLTLYKKQLREYKERLKIAHEEKTCKLAKTWPLLGNRYQVMELLGKGGFSEVYKAYDLDENKNVAIKMSSTIGLKQQLSHYIVREYENHIKLQHPNIAKLYQVVQVTENSVCIALQYCEGPELSTYIKQNKTIEENKARYIMKQILQALLYLGSLSPKIIHYDLKPQNIMFCNGVIKILDFGLSRQIDSEHSRMALSNQGIGTYWYLPPETFNEKNPQISQKVDIWSAGVILYEMLFGKKPFGHNISQANIINQGIILDANQVDFPDDIEVSQSAKSLIRNCLAYNYRQRYTPFQALSHRFFK